MKKEYYLAIVVSILVAVASQWIQESGSSPATPSFASIAPGPMFPPVMMIQQRQADAPAPLLPSSFLDNSKK